MHRISRITIIALLIGLLVASVAPLSAQANSRISYFIAPDTNGVQQVYQLLLDGTSTPRQITVAESDVLVYGSAYDGLGIAYISGGQVWLQPIHTETPEAVATVDAERISAPIFSQDGNYLAYGADGVWLMDLATRETRQILEDVLLAAQASNAGEYRIYQPQMFVAGTNKLIIDIGVWEWNTVGVYDLRSGELQELEGQLHTTLLPLYDGYVLLYGNSGVAGEFALHTAPLTDINAYERVLDFSAVTDATLYAEQAVEIEPGVARVFGTASAAGHSPADLNVFWFDFDTATNTASNFTTQPVSGEFSGQLSPDGKVVAVYRNADFNSVGTVTGNVTLVDLTNGETLTANLPNQVTAFQWQPGR